MDERRLIHHQVLRAAGGGAGAGKLVVGFVADAFADVGRVGVHGDGVGVGADAGVAAAHRDHLAAAVA